jgi:sulfite reductase (NADPH) flavoprotein alpha-component
MSLLEQRVPFIPENAPFSPDQRAWLNGLLAGIFSSAPSSSMEARPSLRVAVLYASQSGTAESLARKLAKELKVQGYAPFVSTLVGYTPAALAAESFALILASTYGDGDAPDGVQPFYEQLCLEHFPRMEKLSYAVMALGDRHYEHFCKFGIDLDAKLVALGANPLCRRVECDVDVDAPFSAWKTDLLTRLNDLALGRTQKPVPGSGLAVSSAPTSQVTATSKPEPAAEKAITRDNPLLAPLIERRPLTRSQSAKVTLHLSLAIAESGLRYESGDSCGVIPKNDPPLVAEILQRLRFNGNERVTLGKNAPTTLHDALTNHLVITRLSRKIVHEYATRGQCAPLLDLLAPEHQSSLERFVYDRGLIDLITQYPGVIEEPTELTAILPKLTPRLYSISSSPFVHTGQIQLTVAVVRYESHNRERGGVCSTLFADRVSVADKLPIYIQPNKRFKLPVNPEAPMIMIGPGTGIAPFRAFLHERRALGHRGKNWLFFGSRHADSDFLYREELENMHTDGHLTRLDTAFSRDQNDKVYVQDRMLRNSSQLWNWIEDGASIYVCGDASRMAKDVHGALCAIVEKEGAMSADAAQEYVSSLKDQHRYHRDVY